MRKILHKILCRILCVQSPPIKLPELIAISGDLDGLRNRPNKITPGSRSRTNSEPPHAYAHNKISKYARQCKGAAEKRASCMPDADRAVFGSARRGPHFVSVRRSLQSGRGATQNPLII